MSKPFVYKARIKVADLFHQSHHEEAFTTALLSKESLSHFALKLLGICALSYEKAVNWDKGSRKNLPDVWIEDDFFEIEVAMFIDWREVDEVSRLAKLYPKLVLLGVEGEHWFTERSVQLLFIDNLSIFSLSKEFVEQLVELLEKSLHWDVVIEDGAISVTDGAHYISTTITKFA
ncbi:YaeQ family protein [Pseudoalteromonas sp. T1lg65]|uniref:YaeQ family protein n=1 Tax=Pseudoalteromonas sp. T1lg65 TaxID=2077101 RepID=UPI003F7B1528